MNHEELTPLAAFVLEQAAALFEQEEVQKDFEQWRLTNVQRDQANSKL